MPILVLFLAPLLLAGGTRGPPATVYPCPQARAIDGDGIQCGGTLRVRLKAIDAPELTGRCRSLRGCTPGDGKAARAYLRCLIAGRPVTCAGLGHDSYGRRISRCAVATPQGPLDLSCAMVAAGHAVERYGRLICPPPRR